jgi:cyanophycinase-like exopeptidase
MSNESSPGSDYEIIASDSFLNGYIRIAPGLSLVPGAVFEPRFMYDYLYGRMVSQVFNHPDVVAVGIQRETALIIMPNVVQVSGNGAVMTIDGRFAGALGIGTNDVMAATWLLLDTFAPQENLTK